MLTEAQALKAGFRLVRGTYVPKHDADTQDVLNRWYWDRTDTTTVDRRTRDGGYATKREALEQLAARLATNGHGGQREGAGRKAVLEGAINRTYVMTPRHIRLLEQWQSNHHLPSASEAVRHMIETTQGEPPT